MREFIDTADRTWQLNVTVAAVKRVREATDVLLPSLFDDGFKLLGELSADFCKLVDVLYAACRPQADAAGISAEQFGEALGGDSLASATEALVRATADFFTSPEQRATLHKALDTILETAGKFTTLVTAQTTTTLATVDTDQLAQNCLDFVTSGQALQALTQTPEPLANSA